MMLTDDIMICSESRESADWQERFNSEGHLQNERKTLRRQLGQIYRKV